MDIEIFYWTVIGTLDGFVICYPDQSTSDTKVKSKSLLYNSRTALFGLFGNYSSDRTFSKINNGVFPCVMIFPVYITENLKDSNLIINQK